MAHEVARRSNRLFDRSLVKGAFRKDMRRFGIEVDARPHIARINRIDGILNALDTFLASHSANFQIERRIVIRLVGVAHLRRFEFLRRVFRTATAAVIFEREYAIHATGGKDHAHDNDRQQNGCLSVHAFHM